MKKHHFIKDNIFTADYLEEVSEPLSPPVKESLSHENRFYLKPDNGQKKSKNLKNKEN